MLRMRLRRIPVMRPQSRAALALVSLALMPPSYAAAVENEDVAELRRILRELQAQNRELSRRLGALERVQGAAPGTKPAQQQSAPDTSHASVARGAAGVRRTSAPATADPPPLPEPRDTSKMSMEERVKELEVQWAAQENATRQIIQNTLSKTGPKINSFLALSGVIEMTASRAREFNGPVRDTLALSTVELDFDVKVSDWLTGALVLSWDSGTSTIFPTAPIVTAPAGSTTGVDRFTLDRTHVLIGDFTQFPIAARFGREVLHFGTSTGVARLDTLSIGTPLTTEVFENRQTAVGLEFAWPTPPLKPLPPPVVIPPVRPLVLAPMVNTVARWLGYTPLPQRPIRPTPITPPFDPPPFYGSFLVYRGSDNIIPNRRIGDYNASLGYRTQGHCGVPYEELQTSLVCPWTLDVHVDYNTSVFDSKFLESAYRPFLPQIGAIPGVAGSVKASVGPFAVVGEINKAIQTAAFFDGLGVRRTLQPMTWQASLAYQFDWNPWVVEIGQQGTFVSVGYSGSSDMAGVTELVNGVPTRVGFVPQNRLFLTAGEWPLDGLRVMLEYSANWDYPQSAGGTGQLAHGVFGQIQLNF